MAHPPRVWFIIAACLIGGATGGVLGIGVALLIIFIVIPIIAEIFDLWG